MRSSWIFVNPLLECLDATQLLLDSVGHKLNVSKVHNRLTFTLASNQFARQTFRIQCAFQGRQNTWLV